MAKAYHSALEQTKKLYRRLQLFVDSAARWLPHACKFNACKRFEMARTKTVKLYLDGKPAQDFNTLVKAWLDGLIVVREHKNPAAFDGIRAAYNLAIAAETEAGLSKKNAHINALSNMTKLLFEHDLTGELKSRLVGDLINTSGFRTTLAQGFAKNVGENFVNLIVYALADLLKDNDSVLIDKGMPPELAEAMKLKRIVPIGAQQREIRIPIEGDCAIFSRSDPLNAIVISAKTRLKEVFHIGTMWKILFDTLNDEHCLKKWGMTANTNKSMANVLYTFATADMVNSGGSKTQGPDVEREEPRNLIAMDASFFDYVFVSKTGIGHVSNQISPNERGSLFHELGCLVSLVEQKFSISLA